MAIEGTYIITIGIEGGEAIKIPMVVSSRPADLYGACSPKNPWSSSMTFEHGKPFVDYGWGDDPHGAEETIAGYIRLGTRVAFLPQHDRLSPPWFGRMFLHTTRTPLVYVPQPPYAKSDIYAILLMDAVNAMLHYNGYNSDWGYCGFRYERVYVDEVLSDPITAEEIVDIEDRWGSPEFVKKLE